MRAAVATNNPKANSANAALTLRRRRTTLGVGIAITLAERRGGRGVPCPLTDGRFIVSTLARQ